MSETKPLTMTAEREAELRGCWTSDPFLVELDAERSAHQQTIQAAEKLAEALAARKCTCNGTGLQHKPGYTHYETDAGEECPAYHYGPCPRCEQARAALAQWEAVRRGK